MKFPSLSSRTACVAALPQPTSMLPLALTASPAGEHPPDEMPARVSKSLVCSTVPAVLIWATPPGLFALNNAGTEIQNEAPPLLWCADSTPAAPSPRPGTPQARGYSDLVSGRGYRRGPDKGDRRVSVIS